MAELNTLTPREREWIDWILPTERSGYKAYRDLLSAMVVIGEGRRGKGEMILGHSGSVADISSPLPPVFAYGAIETNFGTITITLREVLDDQISLEIVNQRSEDVPLEFEEARRWTYSTWSPGSPCPQCNNAVREVHIRTAKETYARHVLAICARDRRLWMFEETNRVNRLVPVTNYYNELMLHKNIRDPKIALDARRLFAGLSSFTDDELTYAFLTYNALKTKVHFDGAVKVDRKEEPGILSKIKNLIRGKA